MDALRRTFGRLRILQRPDAISLIAVAAALVIAGAALISFQFWSLRASLREDLHVQAHIIGNNATAALAFGDRGDANEILLALRASPTVLHATIFDKQGHAFASYARDPDAATVGAGASVREGFSWDHLDVVHPIRYSEGQLGTVRVSGSMRQVYSRIAAFVGAGAITALLAMGVASLLVSGLRRAVRHAEERLKYLAHYDPVTNLLNRHAFNERLDFALERAQRFEGKLALLLLDLDSFKMINDTLGHQVGDTLLHLVGERLIRLLRREDAVCRLGGDEFAVILENLAGNDEAVIVARKVIEKLSRPFTIESHEVNTTVSCGVGIFPDHSRDVRSLIRNADAAMYAAKEAGKNTFRIFTEEMNERVFRRLKIEHCLRKSMDRGEFLLHYQPKVTLKEGRVVGVEALLRWEHPELGKVSPAEFIPVAEETNLIIPLGAWVLRQACAQSVAWEHQGLGALEVSVNLSARQFRDNDLRSEVLSSLRDSGLPPHRLELELTESMLMENVESNVHMLRELRALGVKLSIDDFGTGYSSMSYLRRFPIHTLKIDQSFVRDLPEDEDAATITEAIIAMGHRLRLNLVAEGVENAEQARFLAQNGCNTVQGYLFSPPLSAEQLSLWMSSDTTVSVLRQLRGQQASPMALVQHGG